MALRSFDLAVIGLGAMGSAAAYQAASRGASVVGFDAYPRAHVLGSSGGRSRVIRLSYFEHPAYVPLLRRAWELWERLERESGRRLLHRTGGLYIGPRDGALVKGARLSAELHALPHEMLDPAQIGERAPALRIPDGWWALAEAQAGWLEPEAAIATHCEMAERHGAVLRASEPITRWTRDGSGVRVTTAAGDVLAERLVIVAGPWMPGLVPELAPLLRVVRVPLFWFEPREPVGPLPVWIMETPDHGTFYGFPPDDAGLKVARHGGGEPADPDALDRTPRAEDEARLRRFLRAHLPAADGPLRSTHICMYTLTPDEHFLIDRRDDGVVVASPCSGHGFKFASVIGEVLADLALDGATDHDIAFLSRSRFGAAVA